MYEGIENESIKIKRYYLIHAHGFCGVNVGGENLEFWDEIYKYLESHYQHYQIEWVQEQWGGNEKGTDMSILF